MEEGIRIRKMNISDISQIIKIGMVTKEFEVDSKFKGFFWTKKQLEKWANSKKDALIVAEREKKIIGFIFFAHHVPTGKVTLENAWIEKKFRGKGLIEKLTEEGINILQKNGAIYLCSLAKTDNTSSIKFLEKNKFNKGYDFVWLHRKI